ncbi:MAG: hypothetical protein ACREBR_03095 [bacterium]
MSEQHNTTNGGDEHETHDIRTTITFPDNDNDSDSDDLDEFGSDSDDEVPEIPVPSNRPDWNELDVAERKAAIMGYAETQHNMFCFNS